MLLEHQAKLLAIHWGQKEAPDFAQKDLRKAPRYGKDNTLMMTSEMTRLEVKPEDIGKARRVVVARKGMPPEVPLIGKIAVDMEIVDNDLMDALVCAQTGQAILRSKDRLKERSATQEPAGVSGFVLGVIVERTDEGQIARNFIGSYEDDSKVTVSAQAFQHLADVALMMISIHPPLAGPQDISRICEILEQIGYTTLIAAANQLIELGYLSDARDIFKDVPDIEMEISNAVVGDFQTFLEDGLVILTEQELLTPEEIEKCKSLFKKRFEQADLSVLLNVETSKQNLDLKERLRSKLKSAK